MDIITRKQAKAQNLTNYFTGKACKNGHIAPRNTKSGVCYKCTNACGRKWYNKNKQNIDWKKKRIINNIKNRAKAKKIPFNINVNDLIWPTHCPVLGIELDYSGKDRWRQVSLDRTNPALGYIKDNVVVMSMRANAIKYDASIEELQKVLNYLQQTGAQ